ncbi:hydantoinase B/oxoprolinase family protein [Halosimplex sp. TS25]|uniref:hydantoinase B/oxoprolinase family protein n=1 Tax=Halosimplex rarum TaxID=3396619 RepID=UPI0039E8DFA8
MGTDADAVDGVTVEVVRNYLSSAASEMQRTLVRTAYNSLIYDVLDFGLSIYDDSFNLLADSPGVSVFLGANDYAIREGVERVGAGNIDPGDVVMLNYPYWSSAHTFDVCLFTPVEYDGERVGYAVTRAHWLDIGSKRPAYMIDTEDIYQEGIVFPATKVYKRGEPDEEILDLVRYNVRHEDKVIGDLKAQVAALRTGRERLRALYDRYGAATVRECSRSIFEHGERIAREAVAELPDGSWSAVARADGARLTDERLRLAVTVRIDGDELVVDFSDSADQVDGPLNVPRGMTESISKLTFKALTTPRRDSTDGQFAPLSVRTRAGSIYEPTPPAATGTLWPATLGIDLTFKALAKGLPERVIAATGGDLCNVFVYGTNPRTGDSFVEASNEAVGWGAAVERDGNTALLHPNQPNTQNTPVEVLESKTGTLRVERYGIRRDSGGAGRYRGGLGLRRDIEFTEPVGALTTMQKTKTENWGIGGGEPGAKNVVVVYGDPERGDLDDRIDLLVDNDDLADTYLDTVPDWKPDAERHWTALHRGEYEPGDAISVRSGGGGGYGDPLDRPPEAVREDVRDGYLSRAAARETYGVVVTPGGDLDRQATLDRREAMRNG